MKWLAAPRVPPCRHGRCLDFFRKSSDDGEESTEAGLFQRLFAIRLMLSIRLFVLECGKGKEVGWLFTSLLKNRPLLERVHRTNAFRAFADDRAVVVLSYSSGFECIGYGTLRFASLVCFFAFYNLFSFLLPQARTIGFLILGRTLDRI